MTNAEKKDIQLRILRRKRSKEATNSVTSTVATTNNVAGRLEEAVKIINEVIKGVNENGNRQDNH